MKLMSALLAAFLLALAPAPTRAAPPDVDAVGIEVLHFKDAT